MKNLDLDADQGKVLLCYHCGNQTHMQRVAQHKFQWKDNEVPLWGHFTWDLYFCPVCKKVTLEQIEVLSEYGDPETGPIPMEQILYPAITTNAEMPEHVSNAFNAALKVRNIDGAICLISLRRTLEMMCKDKGAHQGTLYAKLKHLSNEGILPPIIDKMAGVLKEQGNMAAHGDSKSFHPEFVSLMIEFTETILKYVYVLPAKLNEIQVQIDEPAD